MVLARRSDPAEFAAWCERTEEITLEQACRHPLATVRRAAEGARRLGPLIRQHREMVRRFEPDVHQGLQAAGRSDPFARELAQHVDLVARHVAFTRRATSPPPVLGSLVEQLRRDLRRHADWQEDESRFFYAVMRASSEERYAAACELAARPGFIPRRFANPRIEAYLRQEAARRGGRRAVRQWLMTVLAPEAIITVAKQFGRPRKIRLGRDWLADERDRVVPMCPGELSLEHARRYVRQAVRMTLERLILGESTPSPARFLLDRALEGTIDPERLLLDKEDAAGDLGAPMDATPASGRDILSTFDAKGITRRERELLAYRLQHRSSAEIAALLDMPSAGAVRRALFRVRKKLAG